MEYKLKKIKDISAINDFYGLGKDIANRLEKGENVTIKNPPKELVDGGYLVKVKKG